MTCTSEEIRLRYLYRRLILQGKIKISLRSALRLVGPDCGFHLYSVNYSYTGQQPRKKRQPEPGVLPEEDRMLHTTRTPC
jgi:hypothetical protein